MKMTFVGKHLWLIVLLFILGSILALLIRSKSGSLYEGIATTYSDENIININGEYYEAGNCDATGNCIWSESSIQIANVSAQNHDRININGTYLVASQCNISSAGNCNTGNCVVCTWTAVPETSAPSTTTGPVITTIPSMTSVTTMPSVTTRPVITTRPSLTSMPVITTGITTLPSATTLPMTTTTATTTTGENGISKGIDTTGKAIGGGIGSIGKGVGGAIDSTGKGVGGAIGSLGQGVGGAIGSLGQGVGDLLGNIGANRGTIINEQRDIDRVPIAKSTTIAKATTASTLTMKPTSSPTPVALGHINPFANAITGAFDVLNMILQTVTAPVNALAKGLFNVPSFSSTETKPAEKAAKMTTDDTATLESKATTTNKATTTGCTPAPTFNMDTNTSTSKLLTHSTYNQQFPLNYSLLSSLNDPMDYLNPEDPAYPSIGSYYK